MMGKRVKKSFEIETSPDVMKRIERFLALLHHNSSFGHSGLFAMPLDGDGCDKVTVSPKPRFANEVDAIGGVGGGVEIAYDNSYACKNLKEMGSYWHTKPIAGLFKGDELHTSIPSKLYRD